MALLQSILLVDVESIVKHLIYYIFYTPLGSLIATILMDKLGRKALLLGSFSGMVSIEI
jgi:hypothetical protein